MLAETEDTGTEDNLGFVGTPEYRLVENHCCCYYHRKEVMTGGHFPDSRFSCQWDHYKHHQVTPMFVSSQYHL